MISNAQVTNQLDRYQTCRTEEGARELILFAIQTIEENLMRLFFLLLLRCKC
jgi:hypothetical protein